MTRATASCKKGGNSRRYFDGDTLVIETRNFIGKTSIGGAEQ